MDPLVYLFFVLHYTLRHIYIWWANFFLQTADLSLLFKAIMLHQRRLGIVGTAADFYVFWKCDVKPYLQEPSYLCLMPWQCYEVGIWDISAIQNEAGWTEQNKHKMLDRNKC